MHFGVLAADNDSFDVTVSWLVKAGNNAFAGHFSYSADRNVIASSGFR